jgi:hypothetical protein
MSLRFLWSYAQSLISGTFGLKSLMPVDIDSLLYTVSSV